jgi:hypothetical protein
MYHPFRKSLVSRILLFTALLAPEFAAAQRFGPWTKPRNLGPVINAAGYSTQHAAISKDGLSLYITTDRPGGLGGIDIWVSRRTTLESEWQDPAPVPNINSEFNDASPNITIDGHWMYFHSNHPTDCGGNWTATAPQADVYVSHRQDKHDDFRWEAPVNLGCMINTGLFDNGPTYFEDEAREISLLYFTRLDDREAKQKCGNANAGNYDIFVSTRNEDGIWGVAEPVCELSSLYRDTRTAIRRDGLEMFLSSGRPGVLCPPSGRNEDIWVSTRPTAQAVWSTPVNIDQAQLEGDNYPVVNSCYFDGAPALSFDGRELYFFLPQSREVPPEAIQTTAEKQGHDIAKPKITLRVDDFANLDPTVLTGARKVTTEIFAKAGVQAVWLDCPVYHTDCGREVGRPQFILRILAPSMAKDIIAHESLGFAIPCDKKEEACLFYILYYRINALAAANSLSPDRILGHVMAHEIGHTLLGPNAHALFGIMQSTLNPYDTERILVFTSDQSKHLRTELSARERATNR